MKKQSTNDFMNKTGASLLQAVIIGGVIGALMFLGASKIKGLKRIAKIRKSSIYTQGIASGALVYAQFILENRKCIELGTGVSKVKCDGLYDEGNLERLLLFPSTINDINTRYPSYKSKAVSRLNELEMIIKKEDVLPAHPLYSFLYDKKAVKIKELKVKFKSVYDPNLGNVNNVRITVDVISYIKLNEPNTEVSVTGLRQLLVYPRVVNYFSLILNRNLVIGNDSVGTRSNDNKRIVNRFSSSIRSPVGINFYSPIMINEDLFLPKQGGKLISAATFYAPIFIGGNLKSTDNKLFEPENGIKGELFEQLSNFNGVKAGISRIDKDNSLEFLFDKKFDGIQPSTDDMQKCIRYAKRKYEKSPTYPSKSVVKKSTNNSEFYLGLTRLNEFVSTRRLKILNGFEQSGSFNSGQNISSKDAALLGAKIFFDGDTKSISGTKWAWSHIESTVSQNYQLAPGTQEKFPSKGFYEFTKNTKFDKIAQICVDTGAVGSVSSSKYPLLKLRMDTISNNVVKIKMDIETRYKKTTHNVYGPKKVVTYVKKTVTDSKGVTTTITVPVVTWIPRKGPKIGEVSCGLSGEWKVKSNMALLLKPYTFRDNPKKPKSVEAKDSSNGGPSFGYGYETRRINFRVINSGDGLELNLDSYSTSNWKFLHDQSTPTLSKDEEISLANSTGIDYSTFCNSIQASSKDDSNLNPDFSKSAFVSWNYNPISKDFQYHPKDAASKSSLWNDIYSSSPSRTFLNELVINDSNDIIFHVYSVLDRCVVEASAKYVAGFLVCRNLIIKDRTEKLNMYGSFVVDQLSIAKSAYKKGVFWKNIHRKDVQEFFRDKNILEQDKDCKVDPQDPKWKKATSAQDLQEGKNCGSAKLIVKSDPFTWTSFDPACGLKDTKSLVTKCKPFSRSENFISIILRERFN